MKPKIVMSTSTEPEEKACYLVEAFVGGEWRRRTTLRDALSSDAASMMLRWRAVDESATLRYRKVSRSVADHGEHNEYVRSDAPKIPFIEAWKGKKR